MIHPGLVVLIAGAVVLFQIAVVVWVHHDIRGLERRINARMDQVAQTLEQQITRETALMRATQDLTDTFSRAVQRFDEAAMEPPTPRRRRR